MNKNQKKLTVELTKEQFKELFLATMLYSWVRGGLADRKGEDFKKYEALENFLATIANENRLTDLVEKFHDKPIPSDELSELVEEIVEEYDDDVFWHELVVRLGKRDFYRTMTPEEKSKMEKDEWLPERIHELYEKYEKEFEDNDVERLEVLKTVKDFCL